MDILKKTHKKYLEKNGNLKASVIVMFLEEISHTVYQIGHVRKSWKHLYALNNLQDWVKKRHFTHAWMKIKGC